MYNWLSEQLKQAKNYSSFYYFQMSLLKMSLSFRAYDIIKMKPLNGIQLSNSRKKLGSNCEMRAQSWQIIMMDQKVLC